MRISDWSRTALARTGVILWSVGLSGLAAASDSAVHRPPLYDTFVPPALGASFADPAFGTSIRRLSDARNMPDNAGAGVLGFVSTEYPTATPFSNGNRWLILQHQSYFALYDGNGTYVRDLPFAVHAASEPRWSRRDPNLLYYVAGNDLMKLDVATDTTGLVHSFAEYAAIRGRGESDISQDGDHFVFAGDELPGRTTPGVANRFVFVYEISTDTKGPVLDTLGHPFDNLYIAANNAVVIGWIPNGTGRFRGVELFNRKMKFQRQLARALGHMHLTRDTKGASVLLWTNSNDATPLAGCQNGIVKVRLADARQTCLLQLDWSLAVHITAPDGNGWAFVETYAPSNPSPYSAGWTAYTNEIVQLKLDGSEARRLVHHRSRPFDSYVYQPRASVSRDGNKLVFTSNHNLQAILGYPTLYSDAYLVNVPGAASQSPTPTPAPTANPAPAATPAADPAPAPAPTASGSAARYEQDSAAVSNHSTASAGSWLWVDAFAVTH
jgi:hypothetical protein